MILLRFQSPLLSTTTTRTLFAKRYRHLYITMAPTGKSSNLHSVFPHPKHHDTNHASTTPRGQRPPTHRHLRPLRHRQIHNPQTPIRSSPQQIRLLNLTCVPHAPSLQLPSLIALPSRHDPSTPRRRIPRPRILLHRHPLLPLPRRRQRLHRTRPIRLQPLRHLLPIRRRRRGGRQDLRARY